jgi:UDP-glucuronate 4-epimerase
VGEPGVPPRYFGAMRYLVTGAAGFVGSHLAETLAAAGHDVVGVDCFTDYYDPAEKERNAAGLDVLRLDLAEERLDLVGFDGVFHLAGQPGVRSFGDVFALYLRRNLLATQRVFETAAAAGVRVVFTSSSSIYGDAEAYPTPEDVTARPVSPYGLTKLGCEHLARAYARGFGLDAVVLRYFTVYGPRQRPDMFLRRVCDRLLDGDVLDLYGTGAQSRSFTYVGDAVAATVVAMESARGGSVYNVGGGEEASMLEAITTLERISGRRLAVRHVEPARGDVARTKADVSRIAADLGWTPATPLAEGLAAMWSWTSDTVAAA